MSAQSLERCLFLRGGTIEGNGHERDAIIM